MALLYGIICTWVVVLRKLAASKHNRSKSVYEQANATFQAIEQDCKNDEVAMGRPAGYTSQLRLMKQFEKLELARSGWISAERKLNKRKRWEAQLQHWQGTKLPYSFGLLDMALVLKLADAVRDAGQFDVSSFWEVVQTILH